MSVTGLGAPFILSTTGIGSVLVVYCMVLVFATLVLNITKLNVRCVVGGL